MAANVPAKLKAADLTRFIIRAAQLEHAKPVVAYWCEYWIVNQILARGLHNGDSETFNYTMTMMDKLEKIKVDNSTNDAIVDDTVGQAYVEHFALETFFRADRTVKANRVTIQTADTFQAAATFLELANIWAPPDAETQAKIRYAKWNALRIMKAIKEGKDPNESNPKIEPELEENLPALDPNDPEVQALEISRQPTVEEVPDEQDRVEARMARQSSIDESLHPSAQVSARGSPAPYEPYPKDGFPYTATQDDNVSPLEPSPQSRNDSVGGGYFPEVPISSGRTDDILDLGLPQQPSAPPGKDDFESFPPPSIPDEQPKEDYYQQPPSKEFIQLPSAPELPKNYWQYAPPQAPQPHGQSKQAPYQPPPVQSPSYSNPQPSSFRQLPASPPVHQPQYKPTQRPQYQPPRQSVPAPAPQFQQRSHNPTMGPVSAAVKQQLNTDDMAIAKAQKHAKWAISALNFEDAETAVRELREALKTLGAL